MKKGSFKLIFASLLLSFMTSILAVPKKDLWPIWEANNALSKAHIDHQLWQRFLDRYLVAGPSGTYLVRYGAVQNRDISSLNAYLKQMSAVKINEYNQREQLAYWTNLYNALVVKIVLEHYPVKSIRDIDLTSSWFGGGPWDAKLITVNGQSLSLNDIEHRILRPIWKDPRIHYVINCASMGCPNLQRSAFRADNIETLLEKAALDFINNPKGVMIKDNKLIVSKIYDWYKEDFGGTDQAVINHLKHYAKKSLRQELESYNRINSTQYDWLLNDARS